MRLTLGNRGREERQRWWWRRGRSDHSNLDCGSRLLDNGNFDEGTADRKVLSFALLVQNGAQTRQVSSCNGIGCRQDRRWIGNVGSDDGQHNTTGFSSDGEEAMRLEALQELP